MLKLYNTMTRQVEVLQPQHEHKVSLYTCGPTVYHYLQLGNWAAFLRWDMLVRTLAASGYKPNWVMNITDVGHLTGDNEGDADQGEDRLEKGAKREGKTAWEVAEFYTKDFMHGLQALNIQMPNHLIKATDHIAQQITLVEQLEAKEFTYIIDDGVYFDTSKLADYGKLARLKDVELRAGARVELNPQKRNPTDFALWKFSPKGEQRDMEWDSPWGKGFPGWHLECSAMAMEYLGETLDIHAGGIDHIPVHHTNEIAQSEGVTGKSFANMWLHSNFLTVNGTKLSKSLGNSYTLHDLVARGYEPLAFRMLILQSHYHSQADFTWESLKAAHNFLQNLRAMADMRFQPVEASTLVLYDTYQNDILHSLQADLNTPRALAFLHEGRQGSIPELLSRGVARDNLDEFKEFLAFLDRVFGLELLASKDITEDQKILIAKREAARADKDFAKADQVRDELQQQGIYLRDTTNGPLWYR